MRMSNRQHCITQPGVVTTFSHGQHIYQHYTVFHTDMSHQIGDDVYGERAETLLVPEQIAVRGANCLRRHQQREASSVQ